MALTLELLRATLRRDLDDALAPGENDDDIPPDQDCLWSDADLNSYIHRTQNLLARRLHLLRDRFDITLVADQAEYNVPEWFLRSYEAFVNDTGKRPIDVLNLNEIEEKGNWDDYDMASITTWRSSTGPTRALLFEERFYKVTAAPAPTTNEAGTVIRVMIARLPKDQDIECELEIPQHMYEEAYLSGCKMFAYSKDDVDLKNEGLAAKHQANFDYEIDQLRGETHRRVRRAGTVRYGGIP